MGDIRRVALAGATAALLGTSLLAPHAQARSWQFVTTRIPDTGGPYAEPRAAIAPGDHHYITTSASSLEQVVYGSPDGIRWNKLANPPNQVVQTSDVDVVALPTGRVLASELDGVGFSFVTSYSDDQGQSWKMSLGTRYPDSDRQFFATGPNDPRTTQPRVYMVFHNLFSGLVTHNIFVSTSTDGGQSFGVPVPITSPGQQAYLDLQCADGYQSNIFVNQKTGQVYVAFGTRSSPIGGCGAQPLAYNIVPSDRVWVAKASLDGATQASGWTSSLAVDNSSSGKLTAMQFAPGAVDDAGNVFVVYAESPHRYPNYDGAAIKFVHAGPELTRWSKPITVAPSGGVGHILPHVVAGDAGKIALAYYTGNNDRVWHSEVAQILDALALKPHITRTRPARVAVEYGSASKLMGQCNGCNRSADLFGIALDSCGRLFVAFPAETGSASVQGTYASQQVSGQRLRSASCPPVRR